MPIQPIPCPTCECPEDVVIQTCEVGCSETATVTAVPANTVTTTLSLANPNRRGLMIFNDSSADLFIKLGAGASTTSFSYKAGTNGYYEIPFGYLGLVTGVWGISANGNALVTEVLP